MAVTPEGNLKEEIRALLKSKGAYYTMVIGGANGIKGSPDMVVCYKGRFIGLEVKTPTGKASGYQERRIRSIKNAGGLAFKPRSVEDVERILDSIDKEKVQCQE